MTKRVLCAHCAEEIGKEHCDACQLPVCDECRKASNETECRHWSNPVASESPAETTPFEELVSALEEAGRYRGYSECAEQIKRGYGPNIRKGKRDAAAARQSLIDAYKKLEREVGHWRKIYDAPYGSKKSWEIWDEAEDLRAELSRLRALVLTAEQIKALEHLLRMVLGNATFSHGRLTTPFREEIERIHAALRRIATGESPK